MLLWRKHIIVILTFLMLHYNSNTSPQTTFEAFQCLHNDDMGIFYRDIYLLSLADYPAMSFFICILEYVDMLTKRNSNVNKLSEAIN